MNFLFFALVLAFSMIFMHPACLAVSLFSAFAYAARLKGRGALRFGLVAVLPLMLAAAVINPAFSHKGATILAYLPSGNPLTLESILYGAAAAAMLAAVVCWFSCCNEVMTSDKFVYLFGRVAPALSLLLSMTLRFVPRFRAQARVISDARKCVRPAGRGLLARAGSGLAVFSAMVTWSLENAIETADSMKSRGYGLPGRTAFSIYRFDARDRAALLCMLVCGGYVAAGGAAGALRFSYYPAVSGAGNGLFTVSVLAAYLALCLTPVILDGREAIAWKRSRSAL